jgi:aspartokinase
MNGPHFGDRYGIVSDLLTTFKKNNIDLFGLSCTIASITGVVPSPQLESAIQAIKECFEVPSITKRD